MLQSGQAVDLKELAAAVKEQGGGCCVPRSVLGDYTPVTRIDGSGGTYWVSADPDCNNPLSKDNYPSTFEAINVCGKTAGNVDGGAPGARLACRLGPRAAPTASQLPPRTCMHGTPGTRRQLRAQGVTRSSAREGVLP